MRDARYGLPAVRTRADTAVLRRETREDGAMSASADEGRHLRASACSEPGSLRQRVAIDGGRHVLTTDEPARLGGSDSGPAPHELVPAALASCVSTTIVMYARARNWEIGRVRVDVDYDHRSTPRRFTVALRLDPSITPDRLERLIKVAESCPVRRAIESGIEFDEHVAAGAVAAATPID